MPEDMTSAMPCLYVVPPCPALSLLSKQFHHSAPSVSCILRIVAASQSCESGTSQFLIALIVPSSTRQIRQQLLTWNLKRRREKFELDEADSSTTAV